MHGKKIDGARSGLLNYLVLTRATTNLYFSYFFATFIWVNVLVMDRNIALIFLKIALTLPVTYVLVFPLLNPTLHGGVLREVEMLGVGGAMALVLVFLTGVFFYCRDLQRTLVLVRPQARAASPRSVWLMFLIPYNFIEDFFIIINVAKSLREEARHNIALRSLKSFGEVSGLGWCAAQIVSLLPSQVGSIGALVALILWSIHWRFIRRVNTILAGSTRVS